MEEALISECIIISVEGTEIGRSGCVESMLLHITWHEGRSSSQVR
ncbi:unnamed protein product, partial [Porites evermanni]